jgi:enoyl-CoA hydratase/carnithine racemase
MSALTLQHRPDGVSVLTFDQPDRKANILTQELWRELHDLLQSLIQNANLRGLVLASAKPGIFIAGADLKYLGSVPAPQDPGVRQLTDLGNKTLDLLESLPFATCAAIDGAALGGGLEVAMACDSRLVGTHPRVELGLPETRLGLIPGWGGTQRLPRLVGLPLACEMIANARGLTGPEAVEAGLASAEVASASLLDFACRHVLHEGWAQDRVERRQAMPQHRREGFQAPVPSDPPAHREAMMLLNQTPQLPFVEGLRLETEAFLRLVGSETARAKIAAFFQRPGKSG